MTKQKAAVLEAIRSSPKHLTAGEIYEQVKTILPDVALATVYNNINALEAEGTIRRLRIDGGVDRYDRSVTPHAHFVCPRCGKITDAPIVSMTEVFSNAYHVDVESYEIKIVTTCADCK